MLAAQPFYMETPEAAGTPIEPEEKPLAPRRAAFVAEYLIDLNAAQAAIRAGYAPHSANVTGAQLLADPNIAAAVERGKAQRLTRVGMTADSVLSEMALLANGRLEHYIIDDDGQVQLAPGAPDGAMAAIKSIKRKTRMSYDKDGNLIGKTYDVEVALWDKPGTLKLMGRHVGLFPDRVELVGKGGGPIELAEVSTEELLARHRALTEAATPPPAPPSPGDSTQG